MKKYEPKKTTTIKLPGGDDPRKNVLSGILLILVLFVLVILLSKTSILGGEKLSEYRENHPVETVQSSQ